MGAIRPRSVDSSDRSNLMRAFIIGNGINWARLSYDLMDALSPDRGVGVGRAAHCTRKNKKNPTLAHRRRSHYD